MGFKRRFGGHFKALELEARLYTCTAAISWSSKCRLYLFAAKAAYRGAQMYIHYETKYLVYREARNHYYSTPLVEHLFDRPHVKFVLRAGWFRQ